MSELSAKDGLQLYRTYIGVRPEGAGMAFQTAAVWALLDGVQNSLGIKGDFLEVGVSVGGSAILGLLMIKPNERAALVDMVRHATFVKHLDMLEADRQKRTEFLEMGSDDPRIDELRGRRFRWVHIDANHTYKFVKHDLERFAPFVADDGILALDDFFQLSWPDVTTAIYEFLAAHPEWKVLFIGFNKIYLVRDKAKPRYADLLNASVKDYLNAFGTFRTWNKLEMRGEQICMAKGTVNKDIKPIAKKKGK